MYHEKYRETVHPMSFDILPKFDVLPSLLKCVEHQTE